MRARRDRRPAAAVRGLGAFGERIGLAFQLLDDVLDVTGPPERTGKPRGADLLDGTVTLPLILARERDPELAALDLRSVRDAEPAAEVCDRIAATGALEDTRARALELVAERQGRRCRTAGAAAGALSSSLTAWSSATRELAAALPAAAERTSRSPRGGSGQR